MLEILNRITEGEGQAGDIETLKRLSKAIKSTSLCGLGQTAPNPVLSTLNYFEDEYIAHIDNKRCPAGVCPELLSFAVVEDKCKGCTLCKKVCPVDAITGDKKAPHAIDPELCIKCSACVDKCKFDAISKG